MVDRYYRTPRHIQRRPKGESKKRQGSRTTKQSRAKKNTSQRDTKTIKATQWSAHDRVSAGGALGLRGIQSATCMSPYALGFPLPHFSQGCHAASFSRTRLFPLPSRSFPVRHHCSTPFLPGFFCACVLPSTTPPLFLGDPRTAWALCHLLMNHSASPSTLVYHSSKSSALGACS